MPAQVVVVKRSRRRAFAILRSIPAWLRAVVKSLRLGDGSAELIASASAEPATALQTLEAFESLRGSGLRAPERQSGLRLPSLMHEASLEACHSCHRCIEICPSSALNQEWSQVDRSEETETELVRFDIDAGRCIGCGDCVRICPESLLEMKVPASRVGRGTRPRVLSLIRNEPPSAVAGGTPVPSSEE